MKRRTFILLSTVAATNLLACRNDMSTIYMRNSSYTDNENIEFTSKLAIPPIIDGTEKNGVYHYDLNIREAKHNFFKNILTDTYAINGTYLGPTLRLINGKKISINYTNNLNETITMHGHGMHLPAKMDGTPHQKIAPNTTWSARYKVNQKACTNWYHPHTEGKTAEQVYKGLAGLLIIEDSESQKLDIPKEYGVDDIPIILQDRFFTSSKQIIYSPNMMERMLGYKGDTFVTNGVLNPYLDVEAKEIRLRLLNGSNSSVYYLGFSDERVFKQIATDNSFLQKPVSLKTVRLSPGERAEIVVDLSDMLGKNIYLKELNQNKIFIKLNVSKKASKITKVPEVLTKLKQYSLTDAVNTRKFVLSGRMGNLYINNKSMNMNRIDEIVPVNKVEIWKIYNQKMMMMGMEHNFHIHATHFMILERNNSSSNVLENEKGYKDTVYLAPGDSVKLLVKMSDYTDNKTPYMYHCHFLEHEDRGMMGQFLVT